MKKISFILALSLSLVLAACAKSSSSNGTAMSSKSDTKGANAFPLQRPATGKYVFIFDPKVTAWAAYNPQGDRMRTGRASGGSNYCPDLGRPCRTITGTFTAYREKGPECQSGKYPLKTNGGAPMPNCMFFHRGYAVHGSYSVPDYNASHGCVRVTPAAAQWLNDHVINPGTTVIIKSYS